MKNLLEEGTGDSARQAFALQVDATIRNVVLSGRDARLRLNDETQWLTLLQWLASAEELSVVALKSGQERGPQTPGPVANHPAWLRE